MQVKIFIGASYDMVESDVNAWLRENNDYTIEQISTTIDSKNRIAMTVAYDDKVAKSWECLKQAIKAPAPAVHVPEDNKNWLSEVICDTTDNAMNWINENLLGKGQHDKEV